MHRTHHLLSRSIRHVRYSTPKPLGRVSLSSLPNYTFRKSAPQKPPQVVADNVDTAAKRLSQLKWALKNKTLQLQVLESLEAGPNAPMTPESPNAEYVPREHSNNARSESDIRCSTMVATAKPLQQQPLHSHPADMNARLPKTERDFRQPIDAEMITVSILGSPNAGKSTLVNELVQSTVSIISVRPHSTRERIKAILTKGNKQVVFYDTPGVVTEQNEHRLNRELVTSSWKAIEGADHLIVVIDSKKLLDHTTATEDHLFGRLLRLEHKIPATLVISKMDLVQGREAEVERTAAKYTNLYPFEKTVYTCVGPHDRFGIKELEAHLLAKTLPGPWLFPATQKSDQGDLQRVEDLIRAEVFDILKVPYKVKQRNIGWTELADGTLRVDQDLLVERPGLKKILVGTGGQVIRDITLKAREKIGRALRRRILLILRVKVHARLHTDPTLKK